MSLATKAVETHGEGGVLATKAVETHRQRQCLTEPAVAGIGWPVALLQVARVALSTHCSTTRKGISL